MALTNFQQAYALIGNAKNVLIVSGHKDTNDSYPASAALAKTLCQTGKLVSIFCKESVPENLKFLDNHLGSDFVKLSGSIDDFRDFVISVDISETAVKSVRYKIDGPRLNINIAPRGNTPISEKNVHTGLSEFNYDLIITVGVHDLESIGEEFERNATLFFSTPVINIDKSASNEQYGEVNITDAVSSCCSEITTDFLKKWDEDLIEKRVATVLLAGLITSTNNFQNEKTRPSTLLQASYLMSKEADHQEIIKNLFKTKSFEFLKLLGVAMTSFQYDEKRRLGWFRVSEKDFQQIGNNYKLIPLVIAEFKNTLSDYSYLAVFWESRQSRFCVINAKSEKRIHSLHKNIGGEKRGNNLILNISNEGPAPESKIMEKLRKFTDEDFV